MVSFTIKRRVKTGDVITIFRQLECSLFKLRYAMSYKAIAATHGRYSLL